MTSLNQLRARFPQYSEVSDGDFLFAIRQKYYPNMHPRKFFDSIEGNNNAHVTVDKFKEEYRRDVSKPIDGETGQETSERLGGRVDARANPGNATMQAARAGFQGLTFGAGDEIVARGASLLSGREYGEVLKEERERLARGREQRPVANTAAEILGALTVPGAVVKGAKAAPVATAAKSAGIAGLGGAVYGFNAGEGGLQNRAENAAVSGVISAGVGAAAPFAGRIVERALNNRSARRARRDLVRQGLPLDQLHSEASAAFNAADQVGLPTAGLPAAVQGIAGRISNRPLNPQITPRSAGIMGELEDMATTPGNTVQFGELQDIRRLTDAARRDFSNPTEQRAGAMIAEGIDDFVEAADPSLAQEVRRARDMWSRLRKSEAIDEVIEKARTQASGFENGLRIGLRQILNSKKRRAQFTKAEQDAMRAIVEGTTFGNLMKRLGKLSFGSGQQTNVLSGVTGSGVAGGLGVASFGPAGALFGLAPPAVGYAARRASERGTERAVNELQAVIANGGVAPNRVTPMGRGLLDEVSRRAAQAHNPLGLPAEILELLPPGIEPQPAQ